MKPKHEIRAVAMLASVDERNFKAALARLSHEIDYGGGPLEPEERLIYEAENLARAGRIEEAAARLRL